MLQMNYVIVKTLINDQTSIKFFIIIIANMVIIISYDLIVLITNTKEY